MRWRGRRQSSNVEDRRGRRIRLGRGGRLPLPGGGRAGGLSLSGLVILVVAFFALRAVGIDPAAILAEGPEITAPGGAPAASPAEEEMRRFVAVVLAETEDVWNGLFARQGADYEEPRLVLFAGSVSSACGFASAAAGPFYCPGDRRVYLDLAFFDELARRFRAAGDFAQAYVVAHEVGHHVQNLTGILPRFNAMRRELAPAEANALSVRVELQADCFAGVWAHHTARKGLLEAGDIDEALNAATQVGDDTLQRRSQGYVVPDSFNHGTSAQRRRWFARGLEAGDPAACDTFGGDV